MADFKFCVSKLTIKIEEVYFRFYAYTQGNAACADALAYQNPPFFRGLQAGNNFRRAMPLEDAFKADGVGRKA